MTRTPRTLKGPAGFFGFAVPPGSERVHELAVDLDLDNAAVPVSYTHLTLPTKA